MARQLIIHAPYDARLDTIPAVDRPLDDYELRVRTEVTALSPGTEIRIYTGLEADRFAYRVGYPYILGYNNVGRVVEVGSRVSRFRPGDRVFTRMPHVSEYIVAERRASDYGRPASVNVPASYDVVSRVPDNVASDHAVFSHLLTLGFNALIRGQYRFGENVVVIGLGVVGLGAVAMAHQAGARVAAIGNAGPRLDAARALGADEAWQTGDDDLARARDFGGEAGIDLVIVCADAWAAMRTAIDISRRNTRIAFLGFPGIGYGLAPFDPFAPADFYNRSISYIAVSWLPTDDYPPEYQRFTATRMYDYILDRVACGHLDLTPLVTHHFPIDHAAAAFDLAVSREKSAIGIIFNWNEGAP